MRKAHPQQGVFLCSAPWRIPASAKDSRFGIITTRRLGHAVVRNLLRRRVRELLRAHGAPLQHGHYVVLIPRHTASTASYTELEKDLLRLLKRRHFTT